MRERKRQPALYALGDLAAPWILSLLGAAGIGMILGVAVALWDGGCL
jgi:hypothetical protein